MVRRTVLGTTPLAARFKVFIFTQHEHRFDAHLSRHSFAELRGTKGLDQLLFNRIDDLSLELLVIASGVSLVIAETLDHNLIPIVIEKQI